VITGRESLQPCDQDWFNSCSGEGSDIKSGLWGIFSPIELHAGFIDETMIAIAEK